MKNVPQLKCFKTSVLHSINGLADIDANVKSVLSHLSNLFDAVSSPLIPRSEYRSHKCPSLFSFLSAVNLLPAWTMTIDVSAQ